METNQNDVAAKFATISGEFVTEVEGLSESDLAKQCVPESCTVSALANHMAIVFGGQVSWIQDIVAGRPLPEITMADIDQHNAKQATLNAEVDKDELLERLRTMREQMLTVLQGLSDEELKRKAEFSLAGGQAISARTLAEMGLIAHTEEHLTSLRATVNA